MKKSEMSKAAIAEAEQKLKDMAVGDYGATAIKVELEAQLNRPDYDEDEEYCSSCEGDGNIYCESCDGDGEIENEEQEEMVFCTECDGTGRLQCEDCDGRGWYQNSEDGWNTEACAEFMLENVSQEAREELIYHQFYDDGSVDSEFTFTLPVVKALLAIEFIRAFKKLAEAVGNGLETSGAGMHIAVLNDPNGNYGYGSNNRLKEVQSNNFVRAVTPLLPALYFMGSADHRSRGLGYRRPRISSPWHCNGDKYSAINGGSSCFEFRVFETCYDRPEMFIDYIIVIANCLQFYKQELTDTSMKMELGMKAGSGLTRFYYSENHIKALERGLRYLKPEYKSIATLKAERKFPFSLTDARSFKTKQEQGWKEEYKEAKHRIMFERSRRYHAAVAEYYRALEYGSLDQVQKQLGKTSREYALKAVRQNHADLYGGVKTYLRRKKQQLETERVEYHITV